MEEETEARESNDLLKPHCEWVTELGQGPAQLTASSDLLLFLYADPSQEPGSICPMNETPPPTLSLQNISLKSCSH